MGGGNGQFISPPAVTFLFAKEPVGWLWVSVGRSVAGRQKRGLKVMKQAVQIAIEDSRWDQKYVIRIVSKRREN